MIFLLKLAEKGHIISDICKNDAKLSIVYQGVLRKGLLTESNKITTTGKNLLNFLKEKAPKEKFTRTKIDNSSFESWWKIYPGTDNFTMNGVTFSGTRTLRKDKENCRLKFNAILSEGEYSSEDLIKALEYEVNLKKKESVRTRINKMTFLQNSLTYLNQRSFEPYIELSKDFQAKEEPEQVILKKGVSI